MNKEESILDELYDIYIKQNLICNKWKINKSELSMKNKENNNIENQKDSFHILDEFESIKTLYKEGQVDYFEQYNKNLFLFYDNKITLGDIFENFKNEIKVTLNASEIKSNIYERNCDEDW